MDRGYTMTELAVVVILIGVLAAAGLASYYKAVETTKANGAQATLDAIAQANRAYFADSGSYDNASPITSSDVLVQQRRIVDRDWSGDPYVYSGADQANSPHYVALARR